MKCQIEGCANEVRVWRECGSGCKRAIARCEQHGGGLEAPRAAPVTDLLHARIAKVLGWSVESTQTCSLAALRELVRMTSPKLAEEISRVIQTGAMVTR